jgi:hypothetical protein
VHVTDDARPAPSDELVAAQMRQLAEIFVGRPAAEGRDAALQRGSLSAKPLRRKNGSRR